MLSPNCTATDGQADTASFDLKNPAVRLSFKVGSHKTSPLWLFQNDPKLCFSEDPNGRLTRAPSPPFKLTAIDPVLFSGVQVAYDPGFKVVLAGAVLWLVGMIALFYLHRRRLWILLEPGPDIKSARVSVGAWSSRGPEEFEGEFNALMRRLREALSARDDLKLTQNPLVEAS